MRDIPEMEALIEGLRLCEGLMAWYSSLEGLNLSLRNGTPVAIAEIDGLDRFACGGRGPRDADWVDDLDGRGWLNR